MAKRKITKPASSAQKAARERNWNKGQVLCIRTIANNLHKSRTTCNNEKLELGIIIDACCSILQDWNK